MLVARWKNVLAGHNCFIKEKEKCVWETCNLGEVLASSEILDSQNNVESSKISLVKNVDVSNGRGLDFWGWSSAFLLLNMSYLGCWERRTASVMQSSSVIGHYSAIDTLCGHCCLCFSYCSSSTHPEFCRKDIHYWCSIHVVFVLFLFSFFFPSFLWLPFIFWFSSSLWGL